MFDNFNKGKIFRNDELLHNIIHEIQIVLYHDDFGVSNPLGNKIKKHKTSACPLLCVLGNISTKYGSRLKDIQLALLYPSA